MTPGAPAIFRSPRPDRDDLGRDYLAGIKEGLGDKAKTMIVGETSYELTRDATDRPIHRRLRHHRHISD